MKNIIGNLKQSIRNKKLAIPIIVIIIVAALNYQNILAFAQSIIDSFTTTSSIAYNWNTVVSTTTGNILLEEKYCDPSTWNCVASTTCANGLGDGTYIIVKQADVSSTKQWKTSNTACDTPQCSYDSYQYDDLLPDNSLTFTSYPARDACKTAGGRLPTQSELICIYNNKATFGNNFSSGYYWSSKETSSGANCAFRIRFSDGNQNTCEDKVNSLYVRCVKGW